ncbi:hypothetical protein M9H77_36323 [Catharanthus roseus]|uniref:Uncharacterized protein n=1 Tax=Catharanthus roseus TaxID=4058 RepID=A0ACB9ZTG0_CATRO|nr:hypothetical protein M9H77_36323 [Catharanthus roseus]
MASFGSQNTGCTPSEGTSVPVTPSWNEYTFYLAATTLASGIDGISNPSIMTCSRTGKPLKGLQEQFLQMGVGSDDIYALLGEDPPFQVNEEMQEEEEMSPIQGRRRCGSDPHPEHTPSRVSVTPRSPNPHAMSDTRALRRDTSSSASKKSYGLEADYYILCWTDKGKSVFLLFKEGPAPRVVDSFFDKYRLMKLESGEEEILFRPY